LFRFILGRRRRRKFLGLENLWREKMFYQKVSFNIGAKVWRKKNSVQSFVFSIIPIDWKQRMAWEQGKCSILLFSWSKKLIFLFLFFFHIFIEPFQFALDTACHILFPFSLSLFIEKRRKSFFFRKIINLKEFVAPSGSSWSSIWDQTSSYFSSSQFFRYSINSKSTDRGGREKERERKREGETEWE